MSRWGRALLPAVSLVLAACSGLPVRDGFVPRSADELTAWDLRAAILASGVQSGRGTLRWAQRGEEFEISVSGPFGVGATRLQGTLAGVTVTRGDKRYFSADPARDLAQAVGAPVPLERLTRWIRGLNGPTGQAVAPSRWSWAGWDVSVAERARVGDYLLPVEMQLALPDQQLSIQRMRWILPAEGEG